MLSLKTSIIFMAFAGSLAAPNLLGLLGDKGLDLKAGDINKNLANVHNIVIGKAKNGGAVNQVSNIVQQTGKQAEDGIDEVEQPLTKNNKALKGVVKASKKATKKLNKDGAESSLRAAMDSIVEIDDTNIKLKTLDQLQKKIKTRKNKKIITTTTTTTTTTTPEPEEEEEEQKEKEDSDEKEEQEESKDDDQD